MTYELGQKLVWCPIQSHKERQVVTVVGLRKHGRALLSNGWIVDEDGLAPGTSRMPGGAVRELHQRGVADGQIGY